MSTPAHSRPALVPALVGLAFSAVLAVVHVRTYLRPSADSFCSVDASFDCVAVALSRFSILAGIPLPLWGLFGFLAIASAAWRRSPLLLPLTAFATVASVLLLLEEILAIGSVCLLCEAVHVASVWALVAAIRHRKAFVRPVSRGDLWNEVTLPILLLVGARLFVPPYWAGVMWLSGPPVSTGVDEEGLHWIGAESPTLVVHEWVDYACPHCAIGTSRMKRKVVEHPDTLRLVRRHRPRTKCVSRVPRSCIFVRASLCAGKQGKFWEMDSWLFAHAVGNVWTDVMPAAESIGMNAEAFAACLDDETTWSEADALARVAREQKILDTPAYDIDGQRLDPAQARETLNARL